MKRTSSVLWITLLVTLLTAGAASAGIDVQASAVTWTMDTDGNLRVSGPDGFLLDRELVAGEGFSLFTTDDAGKALADGLYRWNVAALSATPPAPSARTNLVSDDRRGLGKSLRVGDSEWGYFTVDGGAFITATYEQPSSNKDQQILDDLIVTGSICVGFDCVNGESFGFDTLRLKENNLRIRAMDTSNSASFPSVDWQLTFNETSNGGANKFSIDDLDNSRTPFTIEAGARSHALYVESDGDIGIGTMSPVGDIHVKTGNTPTLRLEQDGSSGFTPQTWDVAGNEANFFVRDATNGSTLPLQIKPGAPSASLFIAAGGDVGVGTSSPGSTSQNNNNALMHVRTTDSSDGGVLVENATGTAGGRTLLELRNNGSVRLDQWDSSTGVNWRLTNGANVFRILEMTADTADVEFELNEAGDLSIQGGLTTAMNSLPDYVFEPDYPLLTIDELADFIAENKHLPNIPSAAEIEKTGRLNISEFQQKLLEKIEELTLYTLDQQKTIDELRERLAAIEASGQK